LMRSLLAALVLMESARIGLVNLAAFGSLRG
jgi:hypothetical protein